MIELKPIIKDDGAIIGFAELEHRVTTIDGVGQSGKTTMIVENVKDDLRNGYDILIIDTHEQRFPKPRAGGSIPLGPTNNSQQPESSIPLYIKQF